ncbi:MAG TPA: riboflavin synthase [Cyanobacteria bacterium UBA8156]|jgi:riboflavin synthase|nr:riboflavin synthase [Cyanobacteria bacterium UBA8156]
MFTGLIQAVGQIGDRRGASLYIQCPNLRPEIQLGDSIAVNGVCLTAATLTPLGFWADVSPETARRTNLGHSRWVNLELALRVGDRLGGHFVSGHIDGTGSLSRLTQTSEFWELTVTVPPSLSRYVVEKGSIAINGMSLTVARCNDTSLTAAIVPHTYQQTHLVHSQPGDRVNLEADLIAKYLEKLSPKSLPDPPLPDTLPNTFWQEHGWV